MAILYRTDGAWGAGKGVNLVPAEVDENFYDVDQRIEYLQENPPEAVVPVAINIEGGLFTMQMSDGSTLGPIVMTMPVPQWRGDWMPAIPYEEMDFFVAPDGGMGAVMISHTSAATFDWAALSGGLPVYKQMTGASGTTSGLADLIDVAIAGSADGDLLVYNLAASLWQNKTKAVVATTVLPAFGGDAGSGGTQGMVPAPATGDAAAGKVLGAGGAWVAGGVGGGSGTVTSVATSGGVTGGPITTSGTISLSPIATLNLLANLTGSSAAPTAATLSAILDAVIGSSRGSLLRRGAGVWSALPPGTAGHVLTTGGAGADPTWAAAAGGGASITTSDTPPGSPADGDAWWDSVGGQLYIWYDDGSSSQWVPASNQPGPQGPAGVGTVSGLTAGQIGIAGSATSLTSSIPTTTFVARAGDTMTGALTVAGTVTTAGSSSGQVFEDRATPGSGNAWQWYAQSGVANLFSAGAGAVKFAVSGTGLTLAGGTITTSGIVTVGWVIPSADNAGYCGSPTAGFAQNNSYNYATLSDAALKTDIQPMPPDCLGYVEAIAPKQFKFLPPAEPDPKLEHVTSRNHWGFVAQDVVAATGESGFGGVTIDPESGVAGLSYNDMVATLWQAVRELSAKVQALEAAQ